MREFTKSMFSFTLGMSLFGFKQLVNMFTPDSREQPLGKGTRAFNSVTHTANEQLDDTLKMAFMVGDNMQRGMVDMMFGLLSSSGFDPNRVTEMTNDMMRQSSQMFGQRQQQGAPRQGGAPDQGGRPAAGPPRDSTGWGPMPPPPRGAGGGRRNR